MKDDTIEPVLDGETMMGWRDIATAPRTELDAVILWNGKEVTGGAFWEGGWADWYHDWMNPQPTHWQPLPAPPTREEAE